MQINLYTFSKRTNSTLRPEGDGHIMSAVLKRGSDVLSPVLEVRGGVEVSRYNYAYMSDFDRYYYVEARNTANDLWELRLNVDVLASWITDVIGQNVYAQRTSAHGDVMLNDPLVVPLQAADMSGVKVVTGNIDVIDGNVHKCINVVDASSPTGNRTFIDSSSIGSFVSQLLDRSWYEGLFDKVRGFNPLELINESYILGFDPGLAQLTASAGPADFNTILPGAEISGLCLNPANYTPKPHNLNLSISSPFSDFRCSSRFMTCVLYLPAVGCISIPPETWLAKSVSVSIDYAADACTGGLIYKVSSGGRCIYRGGACLKAPWALTNQTPTLANVIGGAVNIAAGIGATVASGGALALPSLGSVSQGISDIFSPPDPTATGAANGSVAELGLLNPGVAYLALVPKMQNVTQANLIAEVGIPTCKVVSITSGFYQCSGADVAFSGTEKELNDFNRALNTGVYVE